MTQKTPPASSKTSEVDPWLEWAKADLWSHTELMEICIGRVPGTPNRTQAEQRAIEAAGEKIARGTRSGTLQFVPRDDADVASIMYGTHRHYVPAVAATWAVSRFKTFPKKLQKYLKSNSVSTGAPSSLSTESQANDLRASLPEKAKSKQMLQEEKILAAIRELDHKPNALPKSNPGSPGVKQSVRNKVTTLSTSVFDKAWERLRQRRAIANS